MNQKIELLKQNLGFVSDEAEKKKILHLSQLHSEKFHEISSPSYNRTAVAAIQQDKKKIKAVINTLSKELFSAPYPSSNRGEQRLQRFVHILLKRNTKLFLRYIAYMSPFGFVEEILSEVPERERDILLTNLEYLQKQHVPASALVKSYAILLYYEFKKFCCLTKKDSEEKSKELTLTLRRLKILSI